MSSLLNGSSIFPGWIYCFLVISVTGTGYLVIVVMHKLPCYDFVSVGPVLFLSKRLRGVLQGKLSNCHARSVLCYMWCDWCNVLCQYWPYIYIYISFICVCVFAQTKLNKE